jgi:L-aspartate oxidase
MSRDAGVVREATGLTRLLAWLSAAETLHGSALPLIAGRLVAEGALARRESRGAHFRADYPLAFAQAAHTRRTLQDVAARRQRAA